jgi:hypothetical protein
LKGAHFIGAHLNNAQLGSANLNGAFLYGVHLNGANLNSAHLIGADLQLAHLNGVTLTDADLTNADLRGSDMSMARLNGADLTGAILKSANLSGVIYEPTSNPTNEGIVEANNIELLTYLDNRSPLVLLRKQLEDAGLRDTEKKITYALKRRDSMRAGWGEYWFNTIAFDWTSQYGMNPGRALHIWFWLFLVCSIIYAEFIRHPGESGIYLVLHGLERIPGEPLRPRPIPLGSRWLYPFRVVGREARVALYALYFSLMTAFSLGVWDINFGKWLHQFPRTEFELKPKGWARPVAATQAILSVGLIVLWVLTYFGRPFE